MTLFEAAAVLIAGIAAGALNTIVGSGSLLTFPTLLAVGLPPITANVSNTIGLVPGGISGTLGYRRELAGQRDRLVRLGIPALLGGTVGAAILLVLPPAAFEVIVPFLLLFAAGLTAIQPQLTRRLESVRSRPAHDNPLVVIAVFATGIYGGYFGAGQGVILMAFLLVLVHDDPQRLNGLKNGLDRLGERDRRGDLRPRRARRLGRGGDPGGRLDRRRAARRRRGAAAVAGALRAAIVIVGTVVALRMLFPG